MREYIIFMTCFGMFFIGGLTYAILDQSYYRGWIFDISLCGHPKTEKPCYTIVILNNHSDIDTIHYNHSEYEFILGHLHDYYNQHGYIYHKILYAYAKERGFYIRMLKK